ncbi:MAG: fimbria/pilus periplasmic chaperone [Spirochaetota bacterium]
MNAARRMVRHLAFLLALSTLGVARSPAFTMEPMVAMLSPLGSSSIATFRFKNDGTDPVALRFKVVTRALGADGNEQNQPADGSFDIYPSRLVLDPGATAVTKVRWKGGATKLREELAFRFIAEQVPVSFSSDGDSGLKILFRYIASLYVGEDAFKPSILATAVPAVGPDGAAGFTVELANLGVRHVVVEKLAIGLSLPDGGTLILSGEKLTGLTGLNYLPKNSRRIFVPSEAAIEGRSYHASANFDPYN